MTLTGGCLCGQARYEISGEPVVTAICHCKNCQRQSGAAFSVNLGVPPSAITLQGELKTFDDVGDSGGKVRRRFCGACGSPLFSELVDAPALTFVKAGTLDDTASVRPALEVWCKSKQPWLEFRSELPCFEANPQAS